MTEYAVCIDEPLFKQHEHSWLLDKLFRQYDIIRLRYISKELLWCKTAGSDGISRFNMYVRFLFSDSKAAVLISWITYHIVGEELQNEGSDGGGDSNKQVDHDHKHVSWTSLTEKECSWVHDRSNGPSEMEQQVS